MPYGDSYVQLWSNLDEMVCILGGSKVQLHGRKARIQIGHDKGRSKAMAQEPRRMGKETTRSKYLIAQPIFVPLKTKQKLYPTFQGVK